MTASHGPVGTVIDIISNSEGFCVGVAVAWPSGLRRVHRWVGHAAEAEVLSLRQLPSNPAANPQSKVTSGDASTRWKH